ncbi:hypothetical protein D5E86_26785, partial [Vibrio parahaemolyticus]
NKPQDQRKFNRVNHEIEVTKRLEAENSLLISKGKALTGAVKKLEDRQGALVTNYKEGKKACAKIDAAIATQERELKTLRADM